MNRHFLSVAFLLAATSGFAGAGVTTTLVRQQWPWSQKINVDYVVSDESNGVHDVTLSVTTNGAAVKLIPGTVSGDVYGVGPGEHRLSWDPSAITNRTVRRREDVQVSLSVSDEPKMYMVIDVSEGTNAATWAVSFTNAPPKGGWNQDAYKENKIVLRRIPAGTFWMGMTKAELSAINAADNDVVKNATDKSVMNLQTRRQITLTRPYYIGIFPVTMGQHRKLAGENSTLKSYISSYGVKSPSKNVSYKTVRGADAAANWPKHTETSILGRLNAKTSVQLAAALPNYVFELPSHAQWENACRAGTATTFGSGKDLADDTTRTADANLTELGWYVANRDEAVSGLPTADSVHPVGLKLPNRFGLYDMHGNVMEWIRDLYGNNNYCTPTTTDPLVKGTSYLHVWACGGGAFSNVGRCVVESLTDIDIADETSSSPSYYTSTEKHYRGFRLACVYEE